jgi:hypothetical protein
MKIKPVVKEISCKININSDENFFKIKNCDDHEIHNKIKENYTVCLGNDSYNSIYFYIYKIVDNNKYFFYYDSHNNYCLPKTVCKIFFILENNHHKITNYCFDEKFKINTFNVFLTKQNEEKKDSYIFTVSNKLAKLKIKFVEGKDISIKNTDNDSCKYHSSNYDIIHERVTNEPLSHPNNEIQLQQHINYTEPYSTYLVNCLFDGDSIWYIESKTNLSNNVTKKISIDSKNSIIEIGKTSKEVNIGKKGKKTNIKGDTTVQGDLTVTGNFTAEDSTLVFNKKSDKIICDGKLVVTGDEVEDSIVTFKSDNIKGNVLSVSNTKQTSGEMVTLEGTSGQTALKVSRGNVVFESNTSVTLNDKLIVGNFEVMKFFQVKQLSNEDDDQIIIRSDDYYYGAFSITIIKNTNVSVNKIYLPEIQVPKNITKKILLKLHEGAEVKLFQPNSGALLEGSHITNKSSSIVTYVINLMTDNEKWIIF